MKKKSILGEDNSKMERKLLVDTYKKSNGITLIALVVTIIVLLILAGVSINMALGKNGIFEKAKETQKIQALAEEKEKLENARLAAMIDGLGEVTVDSYINELIKEGITTADKVTDNGDGSKTIITENGYEVKITPTESGKNVTIEVKGDNAGSGSGSGNGNTTGNTETGGNNTSSGETTTVLVSTITLNKTSASIAEGTTMQLTATISPENATNKEVEWTSSNTGVATVDQNGKVTTLAEGTTTITVTAKDGSGVKAECKITATMSPSNYTWSQNKTTVTGTHKTISGKTVTYEVGQAYTYNAGVSGGYTGSWGILGAGAEGTEEAGKLLIMTTSDVGTIELKGKDGYNNGISQLDALSAEKCGTGARSINVDDINRVTGYDPENQGDGTVYGAGTWWEYGNVVTYTSSGATASNGNKNTSGLSAYYHPDGRQIGGSGETKVSSIQETSTEYEYYPYSLTDDSAITGTCKGISTSSKAYEMIFGTYANASSGRGNLYWLASSCVSTRPDNSYFYMRYVDTISRVNYFCMWSSISASEYGTSVAVRAVVAI